MQAVVFAAGVVCLVVEVLMLSHLRLISPHNAYMANQMSLGRLWDHPLQKVFFTTKSSYKKRGPNQGHVATLMITAYCAPILRVALLSKPPLQVRRRELATVSGSAR